MVVIFQLEDGEFPGEDVDGDVVLSRGLLENGSEETGGEGEGSQPEEFWFAAASFSKLESE